LLSSETNVQLTLASPISFGDIITVAYNKPALNPIQTTAGKQAATIGPQSVTNNWQCRNPCIPKFSSRKCNTQYY